MGLLETWSAYRGARDYSSLLFNQDISARPESQPRSVAGAGPTVLCVHGFGGVPLEVELAFDVARDLGLAAVAPVLRGHGTRPSDLKDLRFEDWLAGIRPVFDEARARGPVILIGLSLGSLLCTELYLSAPADVLGLGLLANAFWLSAPFPADALRLVGALRLPDFGMPKFASDLADDEARKSHVTYDIQPVHAALSLQRAGARLREELFRVHCPTLVLHGEKDRVCPVANARKVAERVGTSDVRVVVYSKSRHILTRDLDRERVRAELTSFIRRVARI